MFGTTTFLESALEDISSLNITSCHLGCTSLLLWVKMAICGTSLSGTNSTFDSATPSGDHRGELLEFITGQIERMLAKGWTGWGI
jgi:hypothetical protein